MRFQIYEECGSSSVVERQPSKLRVAGSNPVSRSSLRFEISNLKFKGAHVAQSAEHILGKDEVTGSIPVMGSMNGSGWLSAAGY